jgi:hypothetical protein
MRSTTDTYTGKRFRWNETVLIAYPNGTRIATPSRLTTRDSIHLDPSRVPVDLLAELNPEIARAFIGERVTADTFAERRRQTGE